MTSTRSSMMTATVLEAPGDLRVREVPVPAPGPSEVLIHVKACGLCSTDLKLLHGDYKTKTPVILGHEFAGEVAEIGTAVQSCRPGDRVSVDPNTACGNCEWCRSRRPMFCKKSVGYGVFCDGAFADFILVHENTVYPIEASLQFSWAAMAEPVSCAVHAVKRAAPKPDDAVVVIGGGLQGQVLLQLLRHQGIENLTMVTRSQKKLDLAAKLGVTSLNCAKDRPVEQLIEETKGKGANIVIEAVGKPECVEMALAMAGARAKVVIYGLSSETAVAHIKPFDVLSKELHIVGAWLNPYTFREALNLLACGALDMDPLITHTFPLDEVTKAFEFIEKPPGGFMKAIIVP